VFSGLRVPDDGQDPENNDSKTLHSFSLLSTFAECLVRLFLFDVITVIISEVKFVEEY
jgi:hypothetical protein